MKLLKGYELKCGEDFVYLHYGEKEIAVFLAGGVTRSDIWCEVYKHLKIEARKKQRRKNRCAYIKIEPSTPPTKVGSLQFQEQER